MINGHGDDLHLYDCEIQYNFSSNVYYKGCPPALLSNLSTQLDTVQRYPSPMASELNLVAAEKFELPPYQFLFTNGATEAFYLIAHLFAGKSAAILAPTFAEYEDACRAHALNYTLVDRTQLQPDDFDLVFICNPNNPDGSIIPTAELLSMIDSTPGTTFVIDEAYIEFTNQVTSLAPGLADDLENLIIVRSLTKTFAIPGIRLGYVMADPEMIEAMLNKKMPWSVNTLAIQAGLQLFRQYDQWQFDVNELLAETDDFKRQLSEIDWVTVKPGFTSYFLLELHKGTAAELKEYLAYKHGILIRDATNFKGLKGEHVRLATQDKFANSALIKALKDWN